MVKHLSFLLPVKHVFCQYSCKVIILGTADILICLTLGIMCRISGKWYDPSTVILTVEEFYQHRKKKKSCPWLLKNRPSHYWIIVPVTVEQSCQRLLNNRASDCWTIVLVTVEQSCQPLLKNHATDCWTILPVYYN